VEAVPPVILNTPVPEAPICIPAALDQVPPAIVKVPLLPAFKPIQVPLQSWLGD